MAIVQQILAGDPQLHPARRLPAGPQIKLRVRRNPRIRQ
jgi:hypothetical protein